MIELFVDGAARGNPGPSGVGILLKDEGQVLLERKEYLGEKTNNEAEYIALILGLREAHKITKKISVTSDSELIVKQVKGEYKAKQPHLKMLLEKTREIQAQFSDFKINHSYRENNKEADRLANEAIDEFNEGEREKFDFDYERQEKLF